MELIKRHPEVQSKPWWEDTGNPPQGQIVQEDTTGDGEFVNNPGNTSRDTSATRADSVNAVPRAHISAMVPQPGKTSAQVHADGDFVLNRDLAALNEVRTRKQKDAVVRVNEYALWCIENDLWEEARLHLEKAQTADSASASLANNLGVVYERLGKRDDAEVAYRRARDLNPRREVYTKNFRRLQDRKLREQKLDEDQIDSLATELQDLGLDDPTGENPGKSVPKRDEYR